jgi:homocysteine S-methyltransferase
MTDAFPTSAVLDGGLATQLEAMGHDLSSSLWSASVLRIDPAAITAAHRSFFDAGAQVATTATYQLTPDSLSRAGMPRADFAPLLTLAVAAARQARDEHGSGWVVGSVGPYGASRADGSEYTGAYDLPRARRVRPSSAHTIASAWSRSSRQAWMPWPSRPSRRRELEAVVAELNSMGATTPTWFSFTPAPGGRTTRTGEPLADLAALAAAHPATLAVGVNCCPPEDVATALTELDPAAYELTGVAYPNSGETWDAVARQWRGEAQWDEGAVSDWRRAGATLIGGCCRVFPDQIARLPH